MNQSRLSVEYSTSIYDTNGKLLPESPLNQIYAFESLFAHISGVGQLLAMVDDDKLENMNKEERRLMLENLGTLFTSIGDAGFHALLQHEWPEVFASEEQSIIEQKPSVKENVVSKAAAA